MVLIETKNAPSAIGTYSQAIKIGNMLYFSGQIGLDPVTMQMVGEDVAVQCHQVFKNLQAVATAGGCELKDMVKLTVFLQDLNDFVTINTVMADYFTKPYPARAAVEVARLPKDAKIEIDAIAIIGESIES